MCSCGLRRHPRSSRDDLSLWRAPAWARPWPERTLCCSGTSHCVSPRPSDPHCADEVSPGSCVFRTPPHRTRSLGVWRGAALYVGSLIGPGVLLIPALARQVAGPASVIAWGVLLLLSLPLAYTFGALAVRMPVAAGVSAYARAGLGLAAGAVTGGWFVTAVLIGAPVVALIGGYYVADLTGAGAPVAAALGLDNLCTRAGHQHDGPSVVIWRPARRGRHPRSDHCGGGGGGSAGPPVRALDTLPPHGWGSVGTAASILVWLFVGWEAVAQLAADFDRPAQVPRAIAVVVRRHGAPVHRTGAADRCRHQWPASSRVPLADLIALGFGTWGRDATAMLGGRPHHGDDECVPGQRRQARRRPGAVGHAAAMARW